MPTENILFRNRYKINDSISVVIPTVGEILDNEDEYYGIVSAFTASPMDYMVQLDDAGIDFMDIDEYQLFLLLFECFIKRIDTSNVIDGVDLRNFTVQSIGGNAVLADASTGVTIDRAVYNKIAYVLRKIHHWKKNTKKPGNKEARDYLLERARTKMKRKSRTQSSELEKKIISLVNTEQFKYDFESVRKMTIYQFNESFLQIIRKIDYDNRMFGIYSGTINAKDINQDDLNWFILK